MRAIVTWRYNGKLYAQGVDWTGATDNGDPFFVNTDESDEFAININNIISIVAVT